MKSLFNILLILLTASVYAGGTYEHEHADGEEHIHNLPVSNTIGRPANSDKATKNINVELLDSMKFVFSPALDIVSGDIVRFMVLNNGKIRHEFSIGDAQEQKAHAQLMRNNPQMMHNDGNTVTVEPGESKEITWHFMGKNTVVFACNIPGHFEAGMYESHTL